MKSSSAFAIAAAAIVAAPRTIVAVAALADGGLTASGWVTVTVR